MKKTFLAGMAVRSRRDRAIERRDPALSWPSKSQ